MFDPLNLLEQSPEALNACYDQELLRRLQVLAIHSAVSPASAVAYSFETGFPIEEQAKPGADFQEFDTESDYLDDEEADEGFPLYHHSRIIRPAKPNH